MFRLFSAGFERLQPIHSKAFTLRCLIISLVLILTLLITSPASSANFQYGLDAYKKGDYVTALKHWAPLAEQGDASAQHYLGNMYGEGWGVPQDYKAAVKWNRLAAAQGHPQAQYNLGVMHYQGMGVPQNDKTAVKWLKLSAEQGDADAQYNLGIMYKNGLGVPQDYVRALMWLSIEAANGEANKAGIKLAQKITPAQLYEAQRLALEWVERHGG